MRIVALIDERDVIKRILGHLGLWEQGVRVDSGTDPPPGHPVIEPGLACPPKLEEQGRDDPFPDYSAEPVYLSSVALA